MQFRYGVRWVFVGVVVVAALSFFGNLFNEWRKAQVVSPVTVLAAPYLHGGDQVPRAAFHPGEPFFLHVTTRRTLPCFASFYQRILSFEDGDHNKVTVWEDFHASFGWTGAGTIESNYFFLTPDNIPPGHYYYERTATYQCQDLDPIHQAEPLIPFAIVEK